MKNAILKLIISTVLIIIFSYFLHIRVDNFVAAITTAVILSLLNTFIKPILVLLTIPVTFFTLGLFLLVINTIMVLLTDYFVDGFSVPSFITAFLFSIFLSIGQSISNKIFVD
ncbi:phage holin family protein [Flavobacterium sp. 20NA77.7]|uniref:Phage holin family protein n=1 Tax=Flavobacterium nakdongensis TaxID=3073563 RepID=A0ABY9RBM3_9FLAO|nr:phage holin family protein [Flavobacterium sp. 20NA77.7]WMW77607.1 phage holin family protein [Flavobacterium sp. 20NA77.7]